MRRGIMFACGLAACLFVIIAGFGMRVAHAAEEPDCQAQYEAGVAAYDRFALQEAVSAFEAARACWLARNDGRDNLQSALCLNYTGLILDSAGQYEQAMEYYGATLEITRAELGDDNPDTATVINNIGEVHRKMGDNKSALEHFQKALKVDLAAYGEQHTSVARDYGNMAAVYKAEGDLQTALDYYRKALAIDEAVLPPDSPDLAIDINNLGVAFLAQGDAAAALEQFKKALAIDSAALGDAHPSTARDYNNLGAAYEALTQYAEARAALDKAVSIKKAMLGDEHPDVANAQENLARVLLQTGDPAGAVALFRQALQIREKTLSAEDASTGAAHASLGDALLAAGNFQESVAEYEKALVILRAAYPEDHPDVMNVLGRLGTAHFQSSGDYETALDYYGKALALAQSRTGPDSADAAAWHNAMGTVRLQQSRTAEAAEAFRTALSIYEKVYGENHPDTAMAAGNMGLALHNAGQYQEALKYHERTLAIETRLLGAENPALADTLNNIGYTHDALGDYGLAVEYYERAIKGYRARQGDNGPDVARAHNNLAVTLAHAGEFDRALEHARISLDIKAAAFGQDNPALAAAHNSIGFVFHQMGDYPRAIEHYEKALSLYRNAFGRDNPQVATALSNIGVARYDMGEFDTAMTYYKQALDIQRVTVGESHPEFARTCNNIAEAARGLGDTDTALQYYAHALSADLAAFGENHPAVARDISNIAILYVDLDRFEEALEYSERALNIRKNVFGEDHPDTALSYNNVGYAQYKMDRLDQAGENFQHALEIRERVLGPNHPDVADSWINLAMFERERGNQDQARRDMAKALEALCGDADMSQPGACRLLDSLVAALALAGEMAYTGGDYAAATQYFARAAESLDLVRGNVESDTDKKHMGASFFELFPSGIAAYAALAAETGDRALLEQAFAFAEKGIGRVFLEMLGKRRAQVDGGLPAAVIEEGLEKQARVESARDRVELIERLPADRQDQAVRRAAYVAFEAARSEMDEYRKRLLRDYPAYAELMNPQPRPLSEIRGAVLAPGEAALEYYLGSDVSWLFVITAGSIAIHRLPPGDEIESKIQAYRTKLVNPATPEKSLVRAARDMFDMLVSPAQADLQGVEKLLIVPTGALYFLPFEALARDNAGQDQWLAQAYAIRYAPSLNVLYMAAQRSPGRTGRDWLGFGDPVYGVDDPRGGSRGMSEATEKSLAAYTRGLAGDDTADTRGALWARIPGTGEEVRAIAPLFADGAAFLGPDASEARFKQEAPAGARFLHVASHGTLGEGGAGQPALVLSLIGNEIEDGFLTMTEVFNLKTPARIVVLSACKTGQGRMEAGEGVAGLSRAFLYAGAQSLVVSLWSVADEQTKDLMVNFYKRVNSGEAPESAMNSARRDMIAAGLGPYYWAPFVFVGLP